VVEKEERGREGASKGGMMMTVQTNKQLEIQNKN